MAFLFLFMGAAVGASVMVLSERDRDYYYDYRYQNMRLLGTKDGAEIWQDRASGVYYVDDGWDVRLVGTPGFVPHPVDRQHLKMLCDKFNPEDSRWVDFLLAAYEGNTDALWKRYFDTLELGPKPDAPTWGKGIRKSRWAGYERELELWEAKRQELLPRHTEELQMWEEQKQVYNEDHAGMRRAASGAALLQRALSTNNRGQQPPNRLFTQQYTAVVPPGYSAGDMFPVKCMGTEVVVPVPPGARPGDTVTFMGPPPAVPVAAAKPVASAPPPAIAPPAFAPPPTAAPPPPPTAAPPPPPTTAPPPPPPGALPRKSSMKW